MPKRVFKSKKKLSGVRAVYRAWKEWETGDYVIGTYKGSKTDSYGKPNWLLQVEDASFIDHKTAKKIVGQIIGLNSNGMLDKAMDGVEIGEIVQVTYNGTSEITEGKYKGKESHLVEVDIM